MSENKIGLSHTASQYRTALPKVNDLGFWGWTSRIASICGVVGVAITLFYSPSTYNEYVYSGFSLLVIVLLSIYLLMYQKRKLHRYAEAVLYLHFVNHVIRDSIEEQRITCSNKVALGHVIQELLDAVANSFSIITGKKCRSCLKELTDGQDIETIARDSMSQPGERSTNRTVEHKLEDNTDFKKLWYGQDGCTRYFLSNNLVNQYLSKEGYSNSSFEEVGKPTVVEYPLGMKRIKNWNLGYKSTIVFPIRYLSEIEVNSKGDMQDYWGFLCIDCNHINVFDSIYSPELGGAYADALFTLFNQMKELSENFNAINQVTEPSVRS